MGVFRKLEVAEKMHEERKSKSEWKRRETNIDKLHKNLYQIQLKIWVHWRGASRTFHWLGGDPETTRIYENSCLIFKSYVIKIKS
jgi:6-phosphogluconate dehydrogenase